MIRIQSYLKVLDNSGAKKVKCLQILNCGGSSCASVGDIIVVSIQSIVSQTTSNLLKRSQVCKGNVCHALVVYVAKENFMKYGIWTKFSENAVVLIGKNNNLLGTRIKGTVSSKLRFKGYMKALSLATNVV